MNLRTEYEVNFFPELERGELFFKLHINFFLNEVNLFPERSELFFLNEVNFFLDFFLSEVNFFSELSGVFFRTFFSELQINFF